MVLPLLMSIGLPALAGTGALASVPLLGTMGAAGLAGIGAGLGSFLQTGDIGKGIQTGLTSFLGGKILGGLTGGGLKDSTAMDRILSPQVGAQQAAQSSIEGSKFLTALPTGTEGSLFSGGIQGAAAGAMLPGVVPAAFMGQAMTDAQMMQQSGKDDDDDEDTRPPMPNPMMRTYNPDPFASGGGEGLYFQYQRRPRMDGTQPQYPYYYADGGILSLAKGGEAEVDADAMMEEAGMNEKDLISEAILAIKGMKSEEEAKIILGTFLAKYGRAQYLELIDSVQSGEYDDTVERFAMGEKGIVKGPGDGSGKDDMVPATLDGQQDVLLTEDEFVLRQPTTNALEKAFGGGFLDKINEAEKDAPEVLRRMVG